MKDLLLCKPGEIFLKGLNKHYFEERLVANVKRRLKPIGHFRVTYLQSALYIEAADDAADLDAAYDAVRKVFGIATITRAAACEKDKDAITALAKSYLHDAMTAAHSFKVETKRSDKRFPMTSIELSQYVGGELAEAFPNTVVDVHDPELTVRLDPEKAGTMGIGFPGSTGEGIMMASNVGAALTHTGDMMCVLKDYEIMAEHDGTSATANVSSFISRDNTVLVGANGKRFVDEKDSGYMTQKLNGPVFDQMHRDGLGYVWAISDQASLDEKGVKRGLDMAFVVADTFEELAEKMGLDAATLSETLTNYNAYCDAGHDPEFGRLKLAKLNAPYCAVRVTPCEIITYGGIARNENAEVIRADGAVIPGLYTAGEATASSAYMGFTISNAFTWGRIAGSGAAAFALAK